MAIYKAKDFVESYRIRALSKDINELTGRTGRPDLTKFVINNLASKFEFKADSIVVDVGCGDGLFLQRAAESGVDSFRGRLIGLLPTKEEVCRVREHLINTNISKNNLISIELGMLDSINLPDEFADIVVSNGTFLILQSRERVVDALREIRRISKNKAVIFIGELPDKNEMAGKNYGDSITAWLFWILKNQGISQFTIRIKQVIAGIVSKEPFIISPKNIFFMEPKEFVNLIEENCFKIKEYYRHKELNINGNIMDSFTRWDYVAETAP